MKIGASFAKVPSKFTHFVPPQMIIIVVAILTEKEDDFGQDALDDGGEKRRTVSFHLNTYYIRLYKIHTKSMHYTVTDEFRAHLFPRKYSDQDLRLKHVNLIVSRVFGPFLESVTIFQCSSYFLG
jgi:hypothetical protein